MKLIIKKREEVEKRVNFSKLKNKITLRIRFPTSSESSRRWRGGGQDGVFAHSVLHLILAYKLVAPSEGHSRFDLCTKYALLANQPPLNHPGRATQLLVASRTYPPFLLFLQTIPFCFTFSSTSAPRTLFPSHKIPLPSIQNFVKKKRDSLS